jgi:hypothetical protein
MIGESIGTLTKHDLLSSELVHAWLWVQGLWSRLGPAALKAREKFAELRLYENFEALAKSTEQLAQRDVAPFGEMQYRCRWRDCDRRSRPNRAANSTSLQKHLWSPDPGPGCRLRAFQRVSGSLVCVKPGRERHAV